MIPQNRPPLFTRPLIYRMLLSYVIAIPMLFLLLRYMQTHHSLIILAAGLIVIMIVSRTLARAILRSKA